MMKLIVAFFALIVTAFGYADEPIKTEIASQELYQIAKQDNRYQHQRPIIHGIATFVGPDVYGLPSVELSEQAGGKSQILCVLPFGDYFDLRKVSKKDSVSVQGDVRLYSAKHDVVVIKECQILAVNGKNR